MKPDGKLTVHVKGAYDGDTNIVDVFKLEDIKSWKDTDIGLRIYYDDHRLHIPWHRIIEIVVQYNSDEYVKWVRERRDERETITVSAKTGERLV